MLCVCWMLSTQAQGSDLQIRIQNICTNATGEREYFAAAVSDDGFVVVGWSSKGYVPKDLAFRWTELKGICHLGTLPNTWVSKASGLSSDGAYVVGTSGRYADGEGFGGEEVAFLWNFQTGIHPLPHIPERTNTSLRNGNSISGDGMVVVGGAGDPGAEKAFRWSRQVGIHLLDPTLGDSYATGTSYDGSVVVGLRQNGEKTVFIWNDKTGIQSVLTSTNEFYGTYPKLSRDGFTIVGEQNQRAFRWTQKTGAQNLGVLRGDTISTALGVSGDGGIVVGISAKYYSNQRAFFWTEKSGMRDLGRYLEEMGLDLTGWDLQEAVDISPDGKIIVGNGEYQGQASIFLITGLPPLTEAGPESFPVATTAFSLFMLGWMAWYLGFRRKA